MWKKNPKSRVRVITWPLNIILKIVIFMATVLQVMENNIGGVYSGKLFYFSRIDALQINVSLPREQSPLLGLRWASWRRGGFFFVKRNEFLRFCLSKRRGFLPGVSLPPLPAVQSSPFSFWMEPGFWTRSGIQCACARSEFTSTENAAVDSGISASTIFPTHTRLSSFKKKNSLDSVITFTILIYQPIKKK